MIDQPDTLALLKLLFDGDVLMNNTTGRYLSDHIEELFAARLRALAPAPEAAANKPVAAPVGELTEASEHALGCVKAALSYLGPTAPSCSGCEFEWNHAINSLNEAARALATAKGST